MKELITYDHNTMSVIFKLVDDPYFSGSVTNVVYDEGGMTQLDYIMIMHWTLKNQNGKAPPMDLQKVVENATSHAKTVAEEIARR